MKNIFTIITQQFVGLKSIITIFVLFFINGQICGQTLLLEENFDYTIGSVITATTTADPITGWLAHSGNGTANIDVVSGLTFTGYAGSGIGGAANLNATGQDINKPFTAQTSGSIYAAFVIQTEATNSAGYFLHFGTNPITTTFWSRVWVNATGNGIGIGTSTPSTYETITPGTPTLIVIKYDITSKVSSLFILNSYTATEPPANQTFIETATITSVGSIALRQYNAAQRVIVDGIRIGTTWAQAVATASTTFTGTTSADWNVATNWSGNVVPTASDNVIINSGTINSPHITLSPATPAICNDLTINSGAVLTIDAGKALTVNGTLTNNAGTTGIIIKSDATGTGSLIHNTMGDSATIERYIPAWVSSYGWHLLSSPVNNLAIDINFTAIPDTNYDFYKYDASTDYWLNQKVGANNITNFTNGIGYLVSYANAGTHNFVGAINVADASPTLTYYFSAPGTVWNLLGNPYPCALNGTITTWTKTNVDNTIYVMDGTDNTFKTWNGTTGSLTDTIIPAMQGFWVATNGTSPSITIPAIAKRHSSKNFYKTTNILNNHLILNVQSPNNTKDVTFIYFKDGNSDDVDINDGLLKRSLNPLNTQIYSFINNKEYCINALGTYTIPIYVDLGFEPKVNGTFTITANDIESFSSASSIILQDLKTNSIQDLRINPTYNFTADITDAVNRFKLYFDLTTVGINNANIIADNIYCFNNNIYIKSNDRVKLVSIHNVLGQEVANIKQPISNVLSLNQPSGYYIVRVITNNTVFSKKIYIK